MATFVPPPLTSREPDTSGGFIPPPLSAREDKPQPQQKGFWDSLVDKINPIPAIHEWMNRPAETATAMDALHVLNKIHNEAAADPANKGIPVNKWKVREPTAQEKGAIDRGMSANLQQPEGNALTDVTAPAVEATRQAGQGNVAGSAGTLMGAYVVPSAIAYIGSKLGNVKRATEPTTLQSPERTAALQFAGEEGIPTNAAMRTDNAAVKNIQASVANAPGGSGIARKSLAATKQGLANTAENIGAKVSPVEATPEAAGQGVVKSLADLQQEQRAGASRAYTNLEEIENKPESKQSVQVGQRTEPSTLMGPDGQPMPPKVTPIMEDIAAPVDMRAAKQQLAPILAQLRQEMPITQQQSSRGLLALQNIVDSKDFIPASVADQNLSALKQVQREAINPKTAMLVGKALDAMSPAVDEAVSKLGPSAVDALAQGRMLTKAKYATQATMDQLPTEPVQLFQKLTANKDRSIGLLRDVQSKAPDAIPALGRATVQGMLDAATNPEGKPGPTTAYSNWRKLGDSTKQVLFPDPALWSRLDNFFKLAEMTSETPNPSGTALVSGAQFAIKSPWGTPYVIANNILARILFSPKEASMLRTAISGTSTTARAAATGNLLTAIGSEARPIETPSPQMVADEKTESAPTETASNYKPGDTVTLKGVGPVKIKSISPDGTFEY